MRQLVAAVCFALAASPQAFSQEQVKDPGNKAAPPAEKSAKREPSEKQRAHQARMKDCAGRAEGRKGEERKQFMSTCLKGGNATAASDHKLAQQDRMKACSKQAGDKQLKGEERRKFMNGCLKG